MILTLGGPHPTTPTTTPDHTHTHTHLAGPAEVERAVGEDAQRLAGGGLRVQQALLPAWRAGVSRGGWGEGRGVQGMGSEAYDSGELSLRGVARRDKRG